MTKEEIIDFLQDIQNIYGVKEEKAREIAKTIKDKSFFIGKGEVKEKDETEVIEKELVKTQLISKDKVIEKINKYKKIAAIPRWDIRFPNEYLEASLLSDLLEEIEQMDGEE